ncbi:metallopeptidase family protein [Candidatus Parcubacteria bacterium]|nr:metallopeptidase family protein [Candidatus Parcubacteria bacterium]
MNINSEQFEQLIAEALDELPKNIRKRMHNVAITQSDFPSEEQLGKLEKDNKFSLLGIYEGYTQSRRTDVGAVLPDKITLFRVPIINACSSLKECRKIIVKTLKHEIAHHFGSDEIGARKAEKYKCRSNMIMS